jgi:outer membrane protein assembly factor BamE (lipoprotein component of BamABCDE complex)
MKLSLPSKCLLALVLVALSSGCVTHRTVTKDGKTLKSGYVVKKPFEKPGN